MRLFWETVYWLKGIILGIKAMRQTQLGSLVWYEGEKWFINNWAHSDKVTLSQGGRIKGLSGSKPPYIEHVPRAEFRPVRSPAEYIHRFRMIRRWYMTSWFAIDVYRRTNK